MNRILLALLFVSAAAFAQTSNFTVNQAGTCAINCVGGSTPPTPPTPPVPPVPPTPPPTSACAGFDNTITLVENWAQPQRLYAAMGKNDMVVIQFTTGNTVSPSNNLPRIAVAEWQSSPSTRIAA